MRETEIENAIPYLPAFTRWSKSVAGLPYFDVDPVGSFPWHVNSTDKVATAGSCFAQHIARHLKLNGFNYYVVEDGHPLGDDKLKSIFNYGTYSGRYGNLYTIRQLTQLFQRAYGEVEFEESVWANAERQFLDPFRPNIQPDGFPVVEEMLADRYKHLAAVRNIFENCDVFVFTLGLTEAWRSKADGAVFPVCPGVAGGVFDEEKYEFVNFGINDLLGDMRTFLAQLKRVNPKARVILTVSPVPLIATAETKHVLVSTTYSKSALRTVCEEIIRQYSHVAYFPSYEIITGSYNRGRYFAEDLRSVTEDGVEHVMRLFLKHVAQIEASGTNVEDNIEQKGEGESFVNRMQNIVQAACDEELIESSLKR